MCWSINQEKSELIELDKYWTSGRLVSDEPIAANRRWERTMNGKHVDGD